MNKYLERLHNGIIKENPVLVIMLGMCPTLAVTTSAINGVGMGLSTTVVLVFSNLIISLLKNIIPNRVRVPAYIVIVATLVTVVQFLLQGFVPSLYSSLGIYIPLIVVNCIILGRAESYASKNGPILSIFDGIGMGIGFTIGLTILGLIRELLGSGQAFGVQVLPLAEDSNILHGFTPITIFVLAPGAFLVLGCMVAVMNAIKIRLEKKNTPALVVPKPEEKKPTPAPAKAAAKPADKPEAKKAEGDIEDAKKAEAAGTVAEPEAVADKSEPVKADAVADAADKAQAAADENESKEV